ncbi:unnamed protein product [Arctia plantaginis]|uniref:Uncharacterized protein n=1 Tax=Arctia plantaginis TaxID=874455 RepID=A0A8S0YQF9_ARCPL|nr:unnamed protein product [Arctia plantaginis]CAB3239140.1 unnamed protein product [Arctia plantaginis]
MHGACGYILKRPAAGRRRYCARGAEGGDRTGSTRRAQPAQTSDIRIASRRLNTKGNSSLRPLKDGD